VRRGRAAAALFPSHPKGSCAAGQRGPSPTTTTTERSHHLLVRPCGRASTRQPAQDAPAGGLVGTCFLSCFQANRPGTLPLDQLCWSTRRRVWRRSLGRAKRRPGLPWTLVEPCTAISSSAWPELGRRPTARMQTPRTPDTCPSGRPDRTGRVGHRTRGQQTAARPLDGRPHGGHRTRTARRLAWSVSGHPGRPRPRPRPRRRRRRRRPSVGLAGLLGLQRLRRSATHGGDALTAPASAALTATATGQLRNTARYEAAPLGALLSCVGVGGYEGRAMGLRKVRCAGSGW
jgi:hypothetical protein